MEFPKASQQPKLTLGLGLSQVFTMRTLMLVMMVVAAGCAGQSRAPDAPTQYVSSTGQPLERMWTNPDGTIDAKLLADIKKAGYKIVNTNGQVVYCKAEAKLGSRVRSETTCLTAREFEMLHDNLQISMSLLQQAPPPRPGFK
jgi:hypothetical protein